jgi:histidine triad (HIT) family protein
MPAPDVDPGCLICRKHRGEILLPGGAIAQDGEIYVCHAQVRPGQSTAYLGYLMVEPLRHAPGLEDLNDHEAQVLGSWMARMSRALVATEGADHVYAFVIGDAVSHVHVHVVARYPGAAHASTSGPRRRAAARPRSRPSVRVCAIG